MIISIIPIWRKKRGAFPIFDPLPGLPPGIKKGAGDLPPRPYVQIRLLLLARHHRGDVLLDSPDRLDVEVLH